MLCICREGGCDFFQWADETPSTTSAAPAYRNNATATGSSNYNQGNGGGNITSYTSGSKTTGSNSYNKTSNSNYNAPSAGSGTGGGGNCTCGEPANSQLVKKEGPNLGRTFLSCRKRR